MKLIFSLLMGVLFLSCGQGNKAATPEQSMTLQSRLEALLRDFHGDAGIYVRHLVNGDSALVNADTLFPTASMIKVPILIKIFDRLEKEELVQDSSLLYYKDTINYKWKGADALSRFKDGEDITVGKLLAHMLTFSDNHASLWLQKLAGGGKAINEWLVEHGFEGTRMNSRTQGREEDWEVYGWGQTTPCEMAELLVMIREGRAVSPRASEDMLRYLNRSYWDGTALSQIPPWVQAASKQGAVDESRSEVVLVNAPNGDYIFCVITKNQEDTSWHQDNEGFTLIRDVSRLLWKNFEPDSDWEPTEGMEEYW